jgi:aminoglycoside/choline kinase family phosphotransferase
MIEAIEKLETFLIKAKKFQNIKIEQLTPDASTREYFRVNWQKKSAIACVYPESFVPSEQNYLDVTNLFQKADLPVAKIYDFDGKSGIIILEDFGDTILRDVLEKSDFKTREKLLNEAITLIAKIQWATQTAFDLNSIASRLKFNEEKLVWELNFFKTHYFESLKKKKLNRQIDADIQSEFSELSKILENHAKVLCHRDFHAANLMIDKQNNLKIIDHQDARIGSVTYDLVSLLLDRVLETPDKDWLHGKQTFFIEEREKFGFSQIEYDEFLHEFQLMTVQRCLKAIGTFSNQTANCGKTDYVQFIKPMFRIVLSAIEGLNKFPVLRETITNELNKA